MLLVRVDLANTSLHATHSQRNFSELPSINLVPEGTRTTAAQEKQSAVLRDDPGNPQVTLIVHKGCQKSFYLISAWFAFRFYRIEYRCQFFWHPTGNPTPIYRWKSVTSGTGSNRPKNNSPTSKPSPRSKPKTNWARTTKRTSSALASYEGLSWGPAPRRTRTSLRTSSTSNCSAPGARRRRVLRRWMSEGNSVFKFELRNSNG